MSDDWSDDSGGGSEDETGGLAARKNFLAMAKDSVKGKDHEYCAECGKEVFVTTADNVKFKGRVYHVPCFKCTECKQAIRGGAHLEHDHLAYCRRCYEKLFRPKGYAATGTLSSEKQ